MNRRNARAGFLSDKLRYTKRTTTKREFNFIPIPLGRQNSGERVEQNFDLSPPKWASSPRDTPREGPSQKKKKFHVDISLIEPISRLKVSGPKPGAEQEDPTINLAALRAAELEVQKQSSEEKNPPEDVATSKSRVKLTRDPIKRTSEKVPEKNSQNLSHKQSEEKDQDPEVKNAETNSNSTTQTKSNLSTKAQASSNTNSEESGRKSRSSRQGRRSSVSSKDSKPPRSRSGSRSSRVEDSENEDQKKSKVGSSKNSSLKSQRSRSGSRSSAAAESENEVPKSSKISSYKNSSLKSQRLRSASQSSVVEDSENEVPENEVPENEVPKSSKTDSYKKSKKSKGSGGSASEGVSSVGKRSKNIDVGETVSDEKVSSQRRFSRRLSESKKSSGESHNSLEEDRPPQRKRASLKSSDSGKQSTDEGRSRSKKSTEVLRKFEELVAASVPSVTKTRRKSSGSEKSGNEVSSRKRKLSESGKSSGNDLPDVKAKPITRSSSSETPITGGVKTGKKLTRRSGKSTGGRTIGKKPMTRSSSSDELSGVAPFKSNKSTNKGASTSRVISRVEKASELSPGEGPSSRRVISHVDNASELSPGEGPSKNQKVFSIFNKSKSNRSNLSRKSGYGKLSARADSSSDEEWFSPQKPKGSNKYSGSKKGSSFKKAVKSKPKKSASQSSGASSDGRLFSPQKRKVPDRRIPSTDGEKSEMNFIKPSKVYGATLEKDKINQKTFTDVSAEMSEEIPLQDKPLITTFAGLPLSDNEGKSLNEGDSNDAEKERLETNMLNLEDIMDANKEKLERNLDTSRGLKVDLLKTSPTSQKRPVNSITDLDVLWNFLGKSLRIIIKETADEEQKRLLNSMKSFLEQHFHSMISEQLKQKEMLATLKDKSSRIDKLIEKLLFLKQRNRQLSQKIYEKEEMQSPQKEDTILDKFEAFHETFARLKRN